MTPTSPEAYRTQLVVGLTPTLAAEFDDDADSPDIAHLNSLSAAARITLQAQGVRSPEDDIFWYATTVDSESPSTADELATSLRSVRGVAAAYLKPPDSAP